MSSGMAELRASGVKPCARAFLPCCRSRARGKGGQRLPFTPPLNRNQRRRIIPATILLCVIFRTRFFVQWQVSCFFTGSAQVMPCSVIVLSQVTFQKRRVRRNYLSRAAKMLHPVARSRLVPSRPAGRLFTRLNGEEQFSNFRYQFDQAAACWLSGS